MPTPSVEIRKTVRGLVPRLPFEALARDVLSARYQLSLVICGDALARRINTAYRAKTYAPNVLSFPLEKNEGEIFLNIRKAEREAKRYATTRASRLALLYVHGLYHLKGLRHGKHMEAAEQRTLKKFGLL